MNETNPLLLEYGNKEGKSESRGPVERDIDITGAIRVGEVKYQLKKGIDVFSQTRCKELMLAERAGKGKLWT